MPFPAKVKRCAESLQAHHQARTTTTRQYSRPAFTPDWFRKDRNGNIYALNRTFLTDSGLTLDDFLRNSLVAYKESNFVSFVAFDSNGMSALQQVERFSSGAPAIKVYGKGWSPSALSLIHI